MPKKSQAIFSNSSVILLAKLAENLFSKQQTPNTQRWILVPNSNIGYWVKQELTKATSNHVFMGSRIFSSSDALIKHIYKDVCGSNPEMPDYITLPLFIHEILKSSLASAHVQRTLSHSPSYVTSKQLATIFKNFYVFSQLPEKNKHRYHKALFTQLNRFFQPMDVLFQTILSKIQTKQFDLSLHIFGCSHLPYHIAAFFDSLGNFFPVHFYALSPTNDFFGDFPSDKIINLNYKNHTFPLNDIYHQYASPERPTLLANLSYKMQMFQNFCVDHNVESLDLFTSSEDSLPTTSLQYIQNSLQNLQPVLPQELATKKQTLHIQKVYHESREVQEVFTQISRLLNQGVDPQTIFILSPKMETYLPYLRAVFSSNIPLYFINHETTHAKTLKEKLLLLSAFIQTRGHIHQVLQILAHPDFVERIPPNHFTSIQKTLLEIWEIIPPTDPYPLRTLIINIMRQYPFSEMNDHLNLFEIWERVLPVLDTAQSFLETIDPSQEISYSKHLQIFDHGASILFHLSPQEHEYLTLFNHHINSQKTLTFTCALPFFTDFIVDFLSTFRNTSPLYQPGPYVGSLNDVSLLPKCYTFILGANETGTTDFDVADLLALKERNTVSSPEDEENFHFLQTLMTTSQELYISYISSQHSPSMPKYFLQTLLDITQIPEELLTTPLYHSSTFKEPIQLHVSQKHYYPVAQTLTQSSRPPLACFIHQGTSSTRQPQYYTIRSLMNTFARPLQTFLKAQYEKSIHIPKSPYVVQEQIFPHEKYLTALWNALIFDEAPPIYKYSSEFSQTACETYTQLLTSFLQQCNQHPDTTLSTAYLTPYLFQESPSPRPLHIVPPLHLPINDQSIYIQGRIGAIHKKGLYICLISPAENIRPSDPNKRPSSKHSSTHWKNLLEGCISLAVLQIAGILPPDATLDCVRFNNNEIHIQSEPLPIKDPHEYLQQVISGCQKFQNTPFPQTSLQDLQAKTKDPLEALANDIQDHTQLNCFFFYHRHADEFAAFTQEELDLFNSLIPSPKKK